MLNTGKMAGKTVFITGASRGIGEAIGLKCARDGANVVVAAKTAEPHPKLPGTIYTAAKGMEDAGGKSLACVVDIRDEDAVNKSIEETVELFGGIDILVNNASAISLTGTEECEKNSKNMALESTAYGHKQLSSLLQWKCLLEEKTQPYIAVLQISCQMLHM
jgi:NAD(P)-dependent dehydrogenase (short-subunit alcohol dehydrogenase family)